MTTLPDDAQRADRVAAWATGIGIGTAAFTVTWLLANRLLTMFLSSPTGPLAAMATAILVGVVVAVGQGRRLSRSVQQPARTSDRV